MSRRSGRCRRIMRPMRPGSRRICPIATIWLTGDTDRLVHSGGWALSVDFLEARMSSIELILLAGVGLLIGVLSGLVGIGGGILVIPVLMIGFAFSQAEANGTSLAMLLPPIGIFAVLTYSRAGYVNWRFALVLAAGFAPGAYLG